MMLMAKGRKPVGRKRERGEVVPLIVEIDPDLSGAVEACARKEQRTKRVVVTRALQEYLERAGLWPPKPGGEG